MGSPVGGDSSHIVVDSWQDWNGFLGSVDTGEDVSGLQNTGEAFMDLLRRQVVQVKIAVIFFGAYTASFKDFYGHRAGDDITRGQILRCGGVPFHKAFTFAISENSTLAAAAFSDQASSTIDASGVELYELGVLDRETSPSDHTTTITGAGMRASARLVGAAVSSSGQDRVCSLHSVDSSIGHVVGHDTTALVTIHEEIHCEVLHKEDAVVA